MKKFISPFIGLLLLAGMAPAIATGPAAAVFSVVSTTPLNTAHDKATVSVKGTKAAGLISYTVTATSAAQTVKVTVTPPSSAIEWEVPVTGLTGGSSYSFIVTTTDQTGSTDSPAKAFTPIAVPAQPTNVSVVAKNNAGIKSADVSFTQADEVNSLVTKYIITSSQGGFQDCTSPATISGSKVCTFTNTLSAGNKVKFTVEAVNSIGKSVGGISTVDVLVPTTPGDVTLVNAERQTDGSVKVTWAAPTGDAGTPITGYSVALAPANGAELTASVGAVNEASFANVGNGTWTAKVTAKNLAGSGNQVVDATPLSIQSTDQAMTLTPTPTISGTAQVGQSLTAVPGTWDAGVAFTYQWMQDDAPIVGATSSTYTLTTSNLGAVISVTVTATKTGFIDASRTSSNTAAVIAQQSQNQNQNQNQSQNNTPAPIVVAPAPVVTPTPTPTPSLTPTPVATATPTPTPTPTATPVVTAAPSPTASPSATPALKSTLPTRSIPANASVSTVAASVKPANVVQVTSSTTTKTTAIKKNSTIALTLPSVPKGTVVKQVLVGPDGKSYTLVSGTTSKAGQVSSPTLKFAKAGTYTLTVTIGTKKKIVKIVVK